MKRRCLRMEKTNNRRLERTPFRSRLLLINEIIFVFLRKQNYPFPDQDYPEVPMFSLLHGISLLCDR
jgi:hypothetical protein